MAIDFTKPIILVSYGVDLDYLDTLMGKFQVLAGDENLQRITEFKAESLLRLKQRLLWRQRHFGATVFTPREVEALQIERYALMPPARGDVQAYVASRMRISHQRVSAILRQADELMYYFQVATDDYAGWENTGSREYPNWRLVVPTARQTKKTIDFVDFALKKVSKAA